MRRALLIITLISSLVACNDDQTSLQGYVDADYTYISSNFSGNLIRLAVTKGDEIQKGDLLFRLDFQPQEDQLNKANANLKQALAQREVKKTDLEYQQKLLKNYTKLSAAGGVSQEQLEEVNNKYLNAKASLVSQQAMVESAKADLSQARWNEANKQVNSPVTGYVYDTYYTQGELVAKEHPVLSLVVPDNLKVIFYIPEMFLAKVQLNKQIKISCDSCGEGYTATISYISAKTEYTPPYIFSESSRTKFVYRIEAKPLNMTHNLLHPGQPVSIKLLF